MERALTPPAQSAPPLDLHSDLYTWWGDRKSDITRVLFRIKIETSGFHEGMFAHGPLIIAANHRSLLDAVVLRIAVPPTQRRRTITIGGRDFFVPAPTDRGLRWLARTLTCGYIVRTYRVALIGRGDDMGDGVPIITSAIEHGWNVILFPEGTRARTHELGRFRSGVAHIARTTGAAVLPVWIEGSEKVLPVGAHCLRSGTIRMTAGEPIQVQADETNAQFLDRMRERIVSLAGS